MARVSVRKPLDLKKEQKLLDKLFMAISSIGNWQEAEAFLMEFLTKEELAMLAKRLELYKRTSGQEKYKTLINELKVTSQTVSDARKKLRRADVYFLRIMRKFINLDKRLK